MRVRKVSGATSGLAVALSIFLALMGVGMLYLVQTFSGSRQITTATDAGALNVAIAAALVPSIPLASSTNTLGLSTQQVQIETQIQAALGNDPTTGSPNNVNLLNINKVIGYGFIIAMNAAAEGTKTGIANAQAVHDVIEGSSSSTTDGTGTSFPITSIASRLASALKNPAAPANISGYYTKQALNIINALNNGTAGPGVTPNTALSYINDANNSNGAAWDSYFFNQGVNSNPIGLANTSSSLSLNTTKFQTAYLGIGDASNIVASTLANNLPYTNIDSGNRFQITIPQTKDGYIPGYTKINIPGTNINYYFVTNYGDQNPGLRSNYEFNLGTSQPGTSDGVILPPNTFMNQATISLAKLNSSISSPITQTSIASVGTKAYPPVVPVIPGFIVVDNTPQMTYTGPFPGACDNVVCDELGTAIYVLSSQVAGGNGLLFSLNEGLLSNIETWWNSGGYNNSAPVPSTISSALAAGGEENSVYNYSNASAVSSSNLQATLLGKVGSNSINFGLLVCTDQVSDPNNPDNVPLCANEVPTFNTAYHPNQAMASNTNVSGLTAVEMAKDTFFQGFWNALMISNESLGYYDTHPTQDIFNSNTILGYFFEPSYYNYISGLGMYYGNANPISSPTTNIPWGTKGVYGTAVNANSNSSVYTSGIDELGQIYCCSGADWVDPKRMGKITQLLTLPGILSQTSTVNATYYPKYTEQVNNGSTVQTNQYTSSTGNAPALATYNWFMQRCAEMGAVTPAQQAQATQLWNNTQIDVGNVVYFYMNNGNIVCSNSNTSDYASTSTAVNVINEGNNIINSYPPPYPNISSYPTGNTPPIIDGQTYAYSQQYNLLYNVVNAEYDFNISNYMFYMDNAKSGEFLGYGSPSCIVATDYVYVQSATGSGAVYGCLGRIAPRERVDNGPGPGPLITKWQSQMWQSAGWTGAIPQDNPACTSPSPPLMMNMN